MTCARIATWNVNSIRVRLPQVLAWLEAQRPAVLALQETKVTDADFPLDPIRELGYAVSFAGQQTYNGVATLSLEAGDEVVVDLPGVSDPERRLLAATIDGWRIINVYVPNGTAVGSERYAYKLEWLAALQAYAADQLACYPRLIVLGDFNMAPADADVHDPEGWAGEILCSEGERAALRALLGVGLEDVFRAFPQATGTFSWWDYRAGAFRRNHGLRIDLLLVSAQAAAACRGCWIDRPARAAERPSDHAPVVGEFDWGEAG